MPVSNAHLNTHTQVWDGYGYRMMEVADAEAAQEAGKVQITRNLTAGQLMRPDEFKAAQRKAKAAATAPTKAAAALPPGVEPAKKKRTYKTRQMKAKGDK